MATGLETSKIDGLAAIGPASGEVASKIESSVALGITSGMEVTKIDSFSCLIPVTVQHEHIFTGQWIGPPAKL